MKQLRMMTILISLTAWSFLNEKEPIGTTVTRVTPTHELIVYLMAYASQVVTVVVVTPLLIATQ
jgi:hypothetical protein